MLKIIKLLFWTCFMLMGYVYFLYPLLISFVSRLLGKRFEKKEMEPPVSIIITAFNEEQDIARKIENTISLDYPRDKVEIIVGSDGSTDKTNEIVRSFESHGIRLLAFPQNRGKTMVQNDCVRNASHEIIVLMDAAALCEYDCLKKLVTNFADDRVGAVAGKVVFVQSKDNLTTESQGLYWKYELMLKVAESRLGSLIGVDGPLYAIRKALYVNLEPGIISDLITPLLVIRDGHAVVYEPCAVTYEAATTMTQDEFKTRRRIVNRGLAGLSRYPELFHLASRPLLAWQIISHKILRWLAGLYFIIMVSCSFLLISQFAYLMIFAGMMVFLALAYRGLRTQDHPRTLFAVPYYYVLVNWAAMLGTLDYFRGKRVISWKPVRH